MTQHQPYDSSLKAMFKEDAKNLLPHFLPGASLLDTLDVEVLRAPMRVDRVYRVLYQDRLCVLHLEFQASEDDDLAHRLLVYHANLWRDYKHPVISIVVYLFRTPTITSPLRECNNNKELLVFHFQVLKLWELDARIYVDEQHLSIYTLLPAMRNADAHLLLQAIDEMVEYYQQDEARLARQLLWFSLFLRRSHTVPLQEKKKVEERLDTFEQLLEEDEWVRKQRVRWKESGLAEGRAEGKIEGKVEGKVEGEYLATQQILESIVARRYPALTGLAKEQVARTGRTYKLREAIEQIVVATDEATARYILNTMPTI